MLSLKEFDLPDYTLGGFCRVSLWMLNVDLSHPIKQKNKRNETEINCFKVSNKLVNQDFDTILRIIFLPIVIVNVGCILSHERS
jgi:hypothetical protein